MHGSVFRFFKMHNVEVTGAARLYRAASELTAGLALIGRDVSRERVILDVPYRLKELNRCISVKGFV